MSNEQNSKEKQVIKNKVKEPLFNVDFIQRLIFERILGHPEMVGASRW